MKRVFCDRCTVDMTDKRSSVVEFHEPNTNEITAFELCVHCATDFWGWVREPIRLLERVGGES